MCMVWLNGYHGVTHYQFANLKHDVKKFYGVVIPTPTLKNWSMVWLNGYHGVTHYQFANLKHDVKKFYGVVIPTPTLKNWSMVWLNGYHGVTHYQFARLMSDFQIFYHILIPVPNLKNWSMVWLKCYHGVSHYQFASQAISLCVLIPTLTRYMSEPSVILVCEPSVITVWTTINLPHQAMFPNLLLSIDSYADLGSLRVSKSRLAWRISHDQCQHGR